MAIKRRRKKRLGIGPGSRVGSWTPLSVYAQLRACWCDLGDPNDQEIKAWEIYLILGSKLWELQILWVQSKIHASIWPWANLKCTLGLHWTIEPNKIPHYNILLQHRCHYGSNTSVITRKIAVSKTQAGRHCKCYAIYNILAIIRTISTSEKRGATVHMSIIYTI